MPFEGTLGVLKTLGDAARKVLLSALFGGALGLVLNALVTNRFGITGKILRGLLSILPGGQYVLRGFDALGFLFGQLPSLEAVRELPAYPKFQEVARNIQQSLPPEFAEELLKSAENQLGGQLNWGKSTAAMLSVLMAPPFGRLLYADHPLPPWPPR